MEEVQDIPTFEARERLTLKDAVRLSGMSEKTLRRKLEAGLLTGQRETLDYGGFMWMIDARSLAELYPDSAAVRDYVTYLENSLQNNPRPPGPAPRPEEAVPTLSSQLDEIEDEPAPPAKNDFVLYLLEENRNLKEDLRDRERQLRSLQDRALNLERECGEQRGTASTQARVLEWFQRQPLAMLPAADPQEVPAPPAQTVSGPSGVTISRSALTLGAALLSLLVLLLAIKAF